MPSPGPLHREYLDLTQVQVDALPFGIITLGPDGTILRYNANESARSGFAPAQVVGRNFFRDVAPCTKVREFGGLYRDMAQSPTAQSWEFNFVFQFATGEKHVHVCLAYFPERQQGFIMVEDVD